MNYGSQGKDITKTTLHPSKWGAGGVFVWQHALKGGLMMHKDFFLTFSTLSLSGCCCSHGLRLLCWELFWQLYFRDTARRRRAEVEIWCWIWINVLCALFSCILGTVSDHQWWVLHQKVPCAISSILELWGGGRKPWGF